MELRIRMYDDEHNEILPNEELGNITNIRITWCMTRFKYEVLYGDTYHECLVSDIFCWIERTARNLLVTEYHPYDIDDIDDIIIILIGTDNDGVFECIVDMCGYIDDRNGGYDKRDKSFYENFCDKKRIKICKSGEMC